MTTLLCLLALFALNVAMALSGSPVASFNGFAAGCVFMAMLGLVAKRIVWGPDA